MGLRGPSFKKIFGFEPTGRPELKTAEQKEVDQVLRGLARHLEFRDSEQRGLQAADLEVGDTTFAQALRLKAQELEVVESALAAAKKRFWDTHKAVKKKGYAVKEKYSDYLLSEIASRL